MARCIGYGLLTLLAAACEPSTVGSVDAGPVMEVDMGPPAFALELSTDTDCRDLAIPHMDEADPLFGFIAYGPPNSRAEIFASRPACGVTPFFFAGFDIDETGRGEANYTHPGNEDCNDNLIGAWSVFALVRTARTDPIDLYFVNGSCSEGPRCGADVVDHCPASLRDAGP